MKQPELGKKISELRKAKGLTQEELVEKCNISVRTIQRIETGEVTPRSYTVKTIFTALDYELEIIPEQEEEIAEKKSVPFFRNLLLPDIDVNKPAALLMNQLTIGWIFGVIYFILGFLEGAAEYSRYKDDDLMFGTTAYIALKVIILIAYFFFQRSFILIGGVYNNYLLKVVSVVLIVAHVIIVACDIASIFSESLKYEYLMFGAALTFGGIGIIWGIALTRLEKSVGSVAKYAGIFEIIAACFFLTIVFSFMGFIVQVPAELFEIIIIFKTIEMIKAKETDKILV